MSDPNVVGGAVNAQMTMRDHFGAATWSDVYLKRLAALKPKMYQSSGPVGNAVAAGEIVAGWTADFTLDPIIAQGAPIAYVYANPAPASYSTVGLVKQAKRSAAGRLLLEWLTSAESQSLIATKIGQVPANPKAIDGRAVTKLPWYEGPKGMVTIKNIPSDEERTAYIAEFNKVVLGK